jgi:hypothetical protein
MFLCEQNRNNSEQSLSPRSENPYSEHSQKPNSEILTSQRKLLKQVSNAEQSLAVQNPNLRRKENAENLKICQH